MWKRNTLYANDRKRSLHEISNGNGIRLISFVAAKDMVISSTTTYVGEYVKNVKLNDMDEDWNKFNKDVKEIAIEHVGKTKCSKKN